MVAIARRQTYKVRGKSSPTSAARAADSPHRYQWLSLLRAPKAASHSLPPRSSTSSRQPEKAPVFPVLSMQVEAGHTAASNPVCSSCILRSANMARDSGRRNGARLDVAAGAAGDRVRPALSGRVRVVVALPETRSWVKDLAGSVSPTALIGSPSGKVGGIGDHTNTFALQADMAASSPGVRREEADDGQQRV